MCNNNCGIGGFGGNCSWILIIKLKIETNPVITSVYYDDNLILTQI